MLYEKYMSSKKKNYQTELARILNEDYEDEGKLLKEVIKKRSKLLKLTGDTIDISKYTNLAKENDAKTKRANQRLKIKQS